MKWFPLILVWLGVSSSLFANPDRQSAKYETNPEWPVELHTQNMDKCKWYRCPRSIDLEIGLEKEFWTLILNSNHLPMPAWIKKTRTYIRRSKTPYWPRLRKLVAFAHFYVAGGIGERNLHYMGRMLAGLASSELAKKGLPEDASAASINLFAKAFLGYSVKMEVGDSFVDKLLYLEDGYGEWGAVGHSAGRQVQLGLVSKDRVAEALDAVELCQYEPCSKTSSIAPYQRMGMLLSAAEGSAYLGRTDEVEAIKYEGIRWGVKHRFPKDLLAQWVDSIDSMFESGGLVEQWQEPQEMNIRVPIGPSGKKLGCVSCHVGIQVPRHYYQHRD